jgi:hypothetical protein
LGNQGQEESLEHQDKQEPLDSQAHKVLRELLEHRDLWVALEQLDRLDLVENRAYQDLWDLQVTPDREEM